MNPARQNIATRNAILTAAARCFGSRGVAGATMEHIALDACVSKPTIYAHFKNKAGLLDAVVQLAWERRDSTKWPPFQPSRDVEEQLVDILDAHVAHVFQEDNLQLFRALLVDRRARKRMVGQVRDERPSRIASLLRDATQAGALAASEVPVETRGNWLCAMIDGRLLWPVILGITPRPGRADRTASVRSAVHFATCSCSRR